MYKNSKPQIFCHQIKIYSPNGFAMCLVKKNTRRALRSFFRMEIHELKQKKGKFFL